MHGDEKPLSMIIDAERGSKDDRYGEIPLCEFWKAVPSPTEVVQMQMCAKTSKAPGENIIIGSVHKQHPHVMGTLYYPLVLKTFVRLQPPIQYRGGMVHEIYKKKGPQHLGVSV